MRRAARAEGEGEDEVRKVVGDEEGEAGRCNISLCREVAPC